MSLLYYQRLMIIEALYIKQLKPSLNLILIYNGSNMLGVFLKTPQHEITTTFILAKLRIPSTSTQYNFEHKN